MPSGGTRATPLRVAYRLARGAEQVTVRALRGGKVIAGFNGAGTRRGHAYRFTLPARAVPRGGEVTIRTTVRASAGAPAHSVDLKARRL